MIRFSHINTIIKGLKMNPYIIADVVNLVIRYISKTARS